MIDLRVRERLDWREYFDRFVQEHGPPVNHGERLLFRDGWMYSSYNYEGPEWAPPKDPDELKRLQMIYWMDHRVILRQEVFLAERKLEWAQSLMRLKSMPVLLRQTYADEESGTQRLREATPMSLIPYEAGLEAARNDLAECEREIKRLSPISMGPDVR